MLRVRLAEVTGIFIRILRREIFLIHLKDDTKTTSFTTVFTFWAHGDVTVGTTNDIRKEQMRVGQPCTNSTMTFSLFYSPNSAFRAPREKEADENNSDNACRTIL
jgi:hypothetical protein